jgi:endonuclease/exonuclease/phosphatase family metal-dependent hydrolase
VLESLAYPFQAFYLFEDKMPMAESGMMVLSKWPIERAEAYVFTHNSGQRRSGFIMCDIKVPMGTLTFIFVQISLGEKAAVIEQQIEELRRIMDDKIEPDGFLVMAGNFDIDPDGSLMDRLKGAEMAVAGSEKGLRKNPSFSGNILTPCNLGEGRRSDYILYRASDNDEVQGLKELDSGVTQPEMPYPSSHCPVWADLAIQ